MRSIPPPRIFATARSSRCWTADTRARLASSGEGKAVWLDGPARHGVTDPTPSTAHNISAASEVGLLEGSRYKGCPSKCRLVACIFPISCDRRDHGLSVIFIGDLPLRESPHLHGSLRRSSPC